MKLSIITVHYKGKDLLIDLLRSIEEHPSHQDHEIIVVDNSEENNLQNLLKKKFPATRYIKANGNIGFSAGNNLGASIAAGELLVFLNPDTKVFADTLDKLVDHQVSNKKVGIVAPVLIDQDGNQYKQIGFGEITPGRAIVALSFLNKLYPDNRLSKAYWGPNPTRQPLAVDTVPGSALMIRRYVFEKVGGFDERFFLYFEENDLCKRVREAGYKVFIIPNAKVYHKWKGSTVDESFNKKIFKRSRFYYFTKHYGKMNALLVEAFARLGKGQAMIFLVLLIIIVMILV